MQHLEEGTIHAWLDGALSTTEAREVEGHVATCSECSAMVAEARGLIAGSSRIVASLDVVRGNVIPKAPSGRGGRSVWQSLHLTPTRAALAATLMIAISSVLTARHNTADKMIPPANRAPRADTMAALPSPAAAPTASSPVKKESVPTPAPVPANSPAAVSALAAESKDRAATKPAAREEARLLKADVAEARRDVADSKTKASDSLSKIADKAVAVAAAPAPPAVQPPVGAGASASNALQENARRASQSARRADIPSVATTGMTEQLAKRSDPLTCLEFRSGAATLPNAPQRFVVQGVASDTTRHVIRVMAENGRPDSVLAGSQWSFVSPTQVALQFAVNQRTLVLPIRDASSADVAPGFSQRQVIARPEPTVTRVSCRP